MNLSSLPKALLLSSALAGCSDYNLNNIAKNDQTGATVYPDATDSGSDDTGEDTTDTSGSEEMPSYPFSTLIANCLKLDESACPVNFEEGGVDSECVASALEKKATMTAQIETAARAVLSDENITLNDILNGADVPATVYAYYSFDTARFNGGEAWSKGAYIHVSIGDHEQAYREAYEELWPFETPAIDTITCDASAHSYEIDIPKEDAQMINDLVHNHFSPEDESSQETALNIWNYVDFSGEMYVYDEHFEVEDPNYLFDSTWNAVDSNAEDIFRTAWTITGEPTAGTTSKIIQY